MFSLSSDISSFESGSDAAPFIDVARKKRNPAKATESASGKNAANTRMLFCEREVFSIIGFQKNYSEMKLFVNMEKS